MDALATIATGGIAGLVVAAALLLLPWFVGRSAEIAAERRGRYPDIAAELIRAYRAGGPGAAGEVKAALGKLSVDNNPALDAPADAVLAALAAGHDLRESVAALIDAMGRSAVLGNVRHNFSGFGGTRIDHIKTLLDA